MFESLKRSIIGALSSADHRPTARRARPQSVVVILDSGRRLTLRINDAPNGLSRAETQGRLRKPLDRPHHVLLCPDSASSNGHMQRQVDARSTPEVDRVTAALDGRYRMEHLLREGALATVWVAHDVRHDRQVAVKFLRYGLASSADNARFDSEIRTTAKLQHPHILPLIDSGNADGVAYYITPYIAGRSLRDRLQQEKQLPLDDARQIAAQVASALDYAHRHGVIHRDIKPENILLQEGEAFVADLGIAIALSEARRTEYGLSLGTPHYMSPEQAVGEHTIDGRTDVYSLACVVYEMLTGNPPFTGGSCQCVIGQLMTEVPVRPRAQREAIPVSAEHAILRGLEKLPADRFATAGEFSAALAATSVQ